MPAFQTISTAALCSPGAADQYRLAPSRSRSQSRARLSQRLNPASQRRRPRASTRKRTARSAGRMIALAGDLTGQVDTLKRCHARVGSKPLHVDILRSPHLQARAASRSSGRPNPTNGPAGRSGPREGESSPQPARLRQRATRRLSGISASAWSASGSPRDMRWTRTAVPSAAWALLLPDGLHLTRPSISSPACRAATRKPEGR